MLMIAITIINSIRVKARMRRKVFIGRILKTRRRA
jgi:hypothetical protein